MYTVLAFLGTNTFVSPTKSPEKKKTKKNSERSNLEGTTQRLSSKRMLQVSPISGNQMKGKGFNKYFLLYQKM